MKSGYNGWLAISVILIANLSIFFDIPILREISGFLFLLILPGLLILQILKLNEMGIVEKVLLLVGLSIAFLMFFGLLLNNVLLSIGFGTPLSTVSLLISFNSAYIILLTVGQKVNGDPLFTLPDLSRSEKVFLIIPAFFPVLSISGTYIMNTLDNNIVLVFMLILIPSYVVYISLSDQKFPERLYSVVIYLISISLLLMPLLRFPHIHGGDVNIAYYIFQMTLNNLHWSIIEHGLLDACLSISLLPSIFQSIIGADAQECVFKCVYVSICSFTPLAIYAISKKYIGDLYAFLASFFYLSQPICLGAVEFARTNIAIFFVALAVMTLSCDKIDPLKQRILFIIFISSVVVSHYSSAYIFFFMIFFSWLMAETSSRRYTFKRNISLRTVLFLFVVIFIWYAQLTDAAFNVGVTFIKDTLLNLNNFFIEESRTGDIKRLFGQELRYPLLDKANAIITWCTFVLIGIGVLTVVKRYQEMVDISNINIGKPDFLKTKFDVEYSTMTLVSSGLLVAMVALPYLSIGYDIYRLYSLVLVILSVFFVIGGISLSKYLKLKPYLIILLILIPYFMFVTHVAYQIFGAPVSINLNSEGVSYDREYVHDSESCAAKWLAMNSEKNSVISVADISGRLRLISQGKIPPKRTEDYSFPRHGELQAYIYLYYNNVVKDKLVVNGTTCNMSEYSDMFIGKGKIYDSGNSEIYKT